LTLIELKLGVGDNELPLASSAPLLITSVGWVHYYSRQSDQAIDQYKKTLDIEPNFILAHNDLGNAYYQKGMYTEAVDEFIKFKTLSGWKPEMTNALRQAYTVSGIKGFWAKELDLANEESKQHPVATMRMARIYTELGEKDRAFEWLEKAYDERNSLLIFVKVLPHFESLHSDPRFPQLLRRIGLAP
jgi:tetratricopeptide (TPR) repeat protein